MSRGGLGGGARRGAAAAIVALASALTSAALAAEQQYTLLIEPRATEATDLGPWTDGGSGKLRSDGLDGQLHVALDYGLQFTDTLGVQLALQGYGDGQGSDGLTEGWLQWTPVPSSAWRQRVRGGVMLTPVSFENGGPGWTTTATLTPSLLNAWVGEELGVEGVEYSLRRVGAQAGSNDSFGLRVAVFRGNDTSGTVLSWRGWAANDRVTPRSGELDLPERAAFNPGGPFPYGIEYTDPYVEIDGAPGYYLVADWERSGVVRVQYTRYDNRADPLQFGHGEIGWRTRFDALGARWRVVESVDLTAQYLHGDTLAGQEGAVGSVYNGYEAWFAMAEWRAAADSVALRYEHAAVFDRDPTPIDDNRESDHGVTLAWLRTLGAHTVVALEQRWLTSERPERALLGDPVTYDERQLTLAVRWTF